MYLLRQILRMLKGMQEPPSRSTRAGDGVEDDDDDVDGDAQC